jgi:hypothetical protein
MPYEVRYEDYGKYDPKYQDALYRRFMQIYRWKPHRLSSRSWGRGTKYRDPHQRNVIKALNRNKSKESQEALRVYKEKITKINAETRELKVNLMRNIENTKSETKRREKLQLLFSLP